MCDMLLVNPVNNKLKLMYLAKYIALVGFSLRLEMLPVSNGCFPGGFGFRI